MSLLSQTTHSIKWSFLAELTTRLITPIVFLVTRKYIKPEDFGLFLYATVFISLSQIFWGAGLAKVLIQRQERINDSANVIFWTNGILGLLIFIIMIFISPWIADSYQGDYTNNDIKNIFIALGFFVVLSSISSVQNALFQKEFKFKELFWIRLMTVALPGLTSIPMAYYGYGCWALVAGSLVGQFFQTLFLWTMSSWKPKIWFDFNLLKELMKFGTWVMISSLLFWFFTWADSLIIGIYLSKNEVGIYSSGNTFASMIFGLVFAPILPVLYSAFSKIGNDISKLRSKLEIAIKFIVIVSLPIGVGLFSLQNEIGEVFFNLKWQKISLTIGVLGLMHGFSWIVVIILEAYKAIGKPEIETKIVSFCMFFYLAFYLISIGYGFNCFLWTRFSLALLALLVHYYFAKKIFNFSINLWISFLWKPMMASAIMFFILKKTSIYTPNNLIGLLLLFILGLLVYLTQIIIMEKKFIKNEILPLLKW